MTESPEQFLNHLQHNQVPRVPAAAIFLTRQIDGAPLLMIDHLAQLGALPQVVIALTVKFETSPRVLPPDRLSMVQITDGYWQVTVHYGFFEVPDLPAALRQVKEFVGRVDLDKVVYFVERDEIVRAKTRRILSWWRLPLFAFLYRNSVRASDLFNLPAANFIHMGRQIEL